jgi:hypothetical protein
MVQDFEDEILPAWHAGRHANTGAGDHIDVPTAIGGTEDVQIRQALIPADPATKLLVLLD